MLFCGGIVCFSAPCCSRSNFDFPALPLPEEDPERGFVQPQFLSEGVDQVTVIGEVDFLGIVGDNGKSRGLAADLGCVKKFYAPAPV